MKIKLMFFIKIIIIIIALFFSSLFGVALFFFNSNFIDLSFVESKNNKPSVLLDCNGKEIAVFKIDKGDFVFFDLLPDCLIKAFLAAEDRAFFKHSGISFKGIIRSMLVNIKNRKFLQGASTITQQLVSLLFLNKKKSMQRKLKEQLFALLLELRYSKDTIFEAYVNNVYFGFGIYGVAAAAKRFWNCDISEINPNQAAILAAIVRSPKYYSPIFCPLSLNNRKNYILKIMTDLNFITALDYLKYSNQGLDIEKIYIQTAALHFQEYARKELTHLLGKKALYADGLIIKTTLNLEFQKIAETSFIKNLKKLKNKFGEDIDGALVSIDSKDAGILAFIGGFDFNKSSFNRVIKARRQAGSVFKPLIYTLALLAGAKLTDIEIDSPFKLIFNNNIWEPKNNTQTYNGALTLAAGLSFSNNIIVIKTLLKYGIDNLINLAKTVGFNKINFKRYPSLALGCVDITLFELVAYFNIYANSGFYVSPYFIKEIRNKYDELIYKHVPNKNFVFSSLIAARIAKVLCASIERFLKNKNYSNFKAEAFGKTGTTNDSRTCWFVGSIPDLTTAVYIGADDNRAIGNKVYASKTAFPIWFDFNSSIALKNKQFDWPRELKEINIDFRTGVEVLHEHIFETIKIFK